MAPRGHAGGRKHRDTTGSTCSWSSSPEPLRLILNHQRIQRQKRPKSADSFLLLQLCPRRCCLAPTHRPQLPGFPGPQPHCSPLQVLKGNEPLFWHPWSPRHSARWGQALARRSRLPCPFSAFQVRCLDSGPQITGVIYPQAWCPRAWALPYGSVTPLCHCLPQAHPPREDRSS